MIFNLQLFGGRGSSSGAGGGGNSATASKDGTLMAMQPREITTTHFLSGSMGGSRYKDEVLEAKTDNNGNLTFDYATPKSYSGPSAKTNKTEQVTYEVSHGAVNGETFGIDWSKVNSISGQTYALRQEAKAAGLHWDSKKKQWTR